ncbi:Tubulin/FtsZ [Flammula alnicola]|nr:Tubulin/FtsZ [Flammula alnicola]
MGDAGNNWAQGYSTGEGIYEEIMDMVYREAESSDSLEAFVAVHSIARGTGWAPSSWKVSTIDFPRKSFRHTAYSQILTDNADSGVVLDNSGLFRISADRLHIQTPTFDQTNQLILVWACWHPDTHTTLAFLMVSCTPFSSGEIDKAKPIRRTTVLDVMRRLLQLKNRMVSTVTSSNASYISNMNMIMGGIDPADIRQSLIRIRERSLLAAFHHGGPQLSARKLSTNYKVSGLMLAKHTSVASLFKRMLDQYDRLKKRNAFMEQYKKGNVFLRTAWKSSMLHVKEYKAAKNSELYLSYDPIRSDSRIEIDAKIAAGYFRNVTELDLAKAVDLFFKRPQLVRRKEVLEDGTVVHAFSRKKVEQKMSVGQSHESLYGGINLAQFEI